MTPLGSKGNFRIKKRLKRLAVFALAVFLSFQIAPIVLAQNSSSDNFATSQEDSKKPPKEESAEAKALGELRDLVMDFTVPDFGASDNETESETVDDAENKALSTEAPKLPVLIDRSKMSKFPIHPQLVPRAPQTIFCLKKIISRMMKQQLLLLIL